MLALGVRIAFARTGSHSHRTPEIDLTFGTVPTPIAKQVEGLFALFAHPDPEHRRQGRACLEALGSETALRLFERVCRGTWIHPPSSDPTELLLAFAEHPFLQSPRERVRELPPARAMSINDVLRIARGFPNATLRLIWTSPTPQSIAGLRRLRSPSVELMVGDWQNTPLRFTRSVRHLSFFGNCPRVVEAPGLRSLHISSNSSSCVDPLLRLLGPRLERLLLFGTTPDACALPRLRVLRLPAWAPLRVPPLRSVHLGRAVGREALDAVPTTDATQVRVDNWSCPPSTIRDDPRPVWIGGARAHGWSDALLESLPNLQVVDKHLTPLMRHLPTPSQLVACATRTSVAFRRAELEWAQRGRGWVVRSSMMDSTAPIDEVCSLTGITVAAATRLMRAVVENRLVARTRSEALWWVAALRESGCVRVVACD